MHNGLTHELAPVKSNLKLLVEHSFSVNNFQSASCMLLPYIIIQGLSFDNALIDIGSSGFSCG